MTNQPKANDTYEQICREHEELRQLLGSMHRMLAKRLETVARVSEMMASLCDHVDAHFCEEENEGFFDQLIEQDPRVSDRARAVQDEHARLLKTMRRLVELSHDGDSSNEWWEKLERGFHDFSKELMHHESKESELLQEVYTEDIGRGD